ncbi:unnamed protein product [Phyllotreta striolata]|uniref:Uncharacterized protein n=1 Tax=Phyllotreta striolata TaxID=444603 RepID=A0A9N9U1E9_PHYSR|nr:unnamed protein product [Phyllotreta striolata]
MWKYSCVIFAINVLFPIIFCYPYDELMEEQVDDTALVESTIREARAISPKSIHELLEPGTKQAYLHTFGDEPDDDGNVQGYLKKSKDKGDDGYKHFDSFHKKDSDKYGFEVHSEFGKLDKANVETGSKTRAEKKKKSKNAEGDDAKETKRAYEVVEGPEGYYLGEGDSGESQQYADGDSGAEEGEEESSPYSSDYSEGDEDGESYEKSSSYSTSSDDDGDGESEGYNEEEEEED